MRYFVSIDGSEHAVDIAERPDGSFAVAVDGQQQDLALLSSEPVADGHSSIVRVGERTFEVVVHGQQPKQRFWIGGRRLDASVQSSLSRASSASEAGPGSLTVRSPMPGKVVRVLVAVGDRVERGTPVVVVEAMKMQNELFA
ncbi:MAG TPA: biotin/lipoyl-containing protein, partial [Polyangiaceae bacterium]